MVDTHTVLSFIKDIGFCNHTQPSLFLYYSYIQNGSQLDQKLPKEFLPFV